jgi:hypothetical protein
LPTKLYLLEVRPQAWVVPSDEVLIAEGAHGLAEEVARRDTDKLQRKDAGSMGNVEGAKDFKFTRGLLVIELP